MPRIGSLSASAALDQRELGVVAEVADVSGSLVCLRSAVAAGVDVAAPGHDQAVETADELARVTGGRQDHRLPAGPFDRAGRSPTAAAPPRVSQTVKRAGSA